MAGKTWYNISTAVAGRPESNRKARLSGTDVLVYLVVDPYANVLRELLPAAPVVSTSVTG